MAKLLKLDFDKRYKPQWHAVVGRNYGSRCVHDSHRFVHLVVDGLCVLLFKSG
jgi:dynein light chain LC8-type